MKSILLFLLLLSFVAQAQQNEGWITPFAHIEFKNGMVHYHFADIQHGSYHRILPVVYFADKMHMNSYRNDDMLGSDTIAYWKEHIWDVASGEAYQGVRKEDQIYFIRAFLLQTIWSSGNIEKFPGSQAVDIIQNLGRSGDTETEAYARLALGIYWDFINAEGINRN
jgi:hypothetical protein